MRIVGIDPGTKSFDFFGMEDDSRIIVDTSIPSEDVLKEPECFLEILKPLQPLDLIVGPSGYGLPIKYLNCATERDLSYIIPCGAEDFEHPVIGAIKNVFFLLRENKMPVCFTPGVIHLQTVPLYRKTNKLDMGTADKVCCCALALKDEAEYLNKKYDECTFILVEIGYGYTAIIGIEKGRIVDGLGGTSGPPGFLSIGGMDTELAIRIGKYPHSLHATGGAISLASKEIEPEELVLPENRDAFEMLVEGIEKGVASMKVSVKDVNEILISGRLARIDDLYSEIARRVAKYCNGNVRKVRQRAKVAKEAAEGAYIIGEGLLNGKYRDLVATLELKSAKGTMFDYIKVKVKEKFSN
jgi:predicted butyrate kinase (DUF1464 family)